MQVSYVDCILSDYLEKRVVVVRQLPITAYFTFLSIPTEEILQEMRDPVREIFYLVTTPKGKIQQYEKKWLHLPWQQSVQEKVIRQRGGLEVSAKQR